MMSAREAREEFFKREWRSNFILEKEYETRKSLELFHLETKIKSAVIRGEREAEYWFTPNDFQRMKNAANKEEEFWAAAKEILEAVKKQLVKLGYLIMNERGSFESRYVTFTW